MLDLDRRRFLFVTGKGGVGKSTVCAALATALSADGKRVLVATTSAKERISELLGTAPLDAQIRELLPNLYGVALEAQVALREYGQLKLKSRMLLQVHDELVFDAFKTEQTEIRKLVEEKMRTAIALAVPIVVEIGIGKNWLEAH